MATEAKLFNTSNELEKMKEVVSLNQKLKEQVTWNGFSNIHMYIECLNGLIQVLNHLLNTTVRHNG